MWCDINWKWSRGCPVSSTLVQLMSKSNEIDQEKCEFEERKHFWKMFGVFPWYLRAMGQVCRAVRSHARDKFFLSCWLPRSDVYSNSHILSFSVVIIFKVRNQFSDKCFDASKLKFKYKQTDACVICVVSNSHTLKCAVYTNFTLWNNTHSHARTSFHVIYLTLFDLHPFMLDYR